MPSCPGLGIYSNMPLFVFFFNDTATTEIYPLSLHDALPICFAPKRRRRHFFEGGKRRPFFAGDRKSTRLNSSHQIISYAVFCLKKKTHQTLSRNVAERRPGPRVGKSAGRARSRRHRGVPVARR